MSFSAIEFVGRAFVHKSTRYVRIPRATWRQIEAWREMRFKLEGHVFVKTPRPNSIGVVTVALPPGPVGECHVIVERVAASTTLADGFDWSAVPFDGERIVDGEMLVLPTIRSQFRMHRITPWAETLWMLGLYKAEGSKNGHDFFLANKSKVLIRRVASCLASLGVPSNAMRLHIIFGRATRADTLSYYRDLGIRVSTVVSDKTEGQREREMIAELHLSGSRGFLGLLCAALKQLNVSTLPQAAREAFLLGFLDGDATCSNDHGLALKVSCATEAEAIQIAGLVDEFFERAFGSAPKRKQGSVAFEFRRSVSAFNAVKLLSAGAFQHNPARARLLHAAHRVLWPLEVTIQHTLNGYFDEDGQPTEATLQARKALAVLNDEWQHVLEQYPNEEDASVGRKGVLYEFRPTSIRSRPLTRTSERSRRMLARRCRSGPRSS